MPSTIKLGRNQAPFKILIKITTSSTSTRTQNAMPRPINTISFSIAMRLTRRRMPNYYQSATSYLRFIQITSSPPATRHFRKRTHSKWLINVVLIWGSEARAGWVRMGFIRRINTVSIMTQSKVPTTMLILQVKIPKISYSSRRSPSKLWLMIRIWGTKLISGPQSRPTARNDQEAFLVAFLGGRDLRAGTGQ